MADNGGKTGGARPRLVGVCLRYCDAQGNPTNTWLDMKAIAAIAWSSKAIKHRPENPPYGNNLLPAGPEPEKCKPGMPAVPGEPLCWYDGNEWRCD